ncbi:hypothetical protein [Halomonas sp. LBP4]|uniref:hypothetical protein n=1 Tax=Halomonas sp. LBP4 TaxID=2044917 RepID=UPI000D8C3D3E|nr:hypothetical protein [Halomonas sp. LBP4]PXX95832.1 hypothetical protein CR157_16655 [Halomonas sp. LBP4]
MTDTIKATAQRGPGGMTLFTLFALAAILVMGFFLHQRLSDVEATSSDVPPPALIVDYDQVFASFPSDATDEEMEALIINLNQRIISLQEAGYLVLSADAVLGAPNSLRVSPEYLLSEEGGDE